MQVHLVDGTYELFRHHYSPGGGHANGAGREVGGVRGVVRSMFQLLNEGATHVGVACDHVIESFRNDLWETYKDGSGVDPELKQQFGLLEDALEAAGFTVWPMVEVEADDALGGGRRRGPPPPPPRRPP
jgi:5'-3' exonuclease